MKKEFCILLTALLICCAALAESGSPSPTAGVMMITPTPSAMPPGAVYSSEELTVTLPDGLEILDEAERAAYDAATQADYPDAARTILAAVNADCSAAVHFAIAEMDMDAAAAAREAAQMILGSTISVTDVQYGENSYSGFVCAIGEQIYSLYYLTGEGRMLIIGASGLSESEISAMLSGLIF